MSSAEGQEVTVCAYIADAAAINDNLKPYSLVQRLYCIGAEEHHLPRVCGIVVRRLRSGASARKGHAGPRGYLARAPRLRALPDVWSDMADLNIM